MHKIEMNNWMYNVGIVGFLRTILTEKEQNAIIDSTDKGQTDFSFRNGEIIIDSTSIQFSNGVLKGFEDLYFELISKIHGLHDKWIKNVPIAIDTINSYIKNPNAFDIRAFTNALYNLGNYAKLTELYSKQFGTQTSTIDKNGKVKITYHTGTEYILKTSKINDMSKHIEKILKDPKTALAEFKNCYDLLNKQSNASLFLESNVSIFLAFKFGNKKIGINLQSGFMSKTVPTTRKKKYKETVLDPITKETEQIRRGYVNRCIFTQEYCSPDLKFDSGSIPFFGMGGGSGANYFFNGKTRGGYTVSNLTNLILWCSFVGYTYASVGDKTRFLFCNDPSSIAQLFRVNVQPIEQTSNVKLKTHAFIQNAIMMESKRAEGKIANNVSFISIQNNNSLDSYPLVSTVMLSPRVVALLSDQETVNTLKECSTRTYSVNNIKLNLGDELLDGILNNRLPSDLMYTLMRQACLDKKNGRNISYVLERVNTLVLKYNYSINKEKIMNDPEMSKKWKDAGFSLFKGLEEHKLCNQANGIAVNLNNFMRYRNYTQMWASLNRYALKYALYIPIVEPQDIGIYGNMFITGLIMGINISKNTNKKGETK